MWFIRRRRLRIWHRAPAISSVARSAGSSFMPLASPISPSNRIATIDILRGIALFIVLIINTATEFRVSIFQQFLPGAKAATLGDQLSEAVILALHTKGFIL